MLESHGVAVHLFEDESTRTPDSVFPNNWFSTHAGGHVAIYPMKAESRRLERRQDVIEMLKSRYRVQDIIDYSGLEPDGLFLEGTGAMVLDHIDRVAYAVRSDRTDPLRSNDSRPISTSNRWCSMLVTRRACRSITPMSSCASARITR